MQNQEQELRALLVTELLKAKEQEIRTAKAGESSAIEKYKRCRQRMKDSLLKQKQLEEELSELRASRLDTVGLQKADGDCLTSEKQRAIDAEAACQEALAERDKLAQEITELKTMLEARTSEFNNSVNKYKIQAQNAMAECSTAEFNCQRLQTELEGARRESQALRSQATEHAASQQPRAIEIQTETDLKISCVLDGLPLVDNHPCQDLKPIGKHLKQIIACLPKDIRASIDGPGKHTFLSHQIIFNGDSQQHGYVLRPQLGLDCSDNSGIERVVETDISLRYRRPYHIPFEAFCRRRSLWYYLGTYIGFRICDAPWQTFSRWTDAVVTELITSTIIGSEHARNDPNRCQRVREMYRSGELKACYLGIKCVGFSDSLYQHLCRASEAAEKSHSEGGTKRQHEDDTNHFHPSKRQKMHLHPPETTADSNECQIMNLCSSPSKDIKTEA